MLVLFSSNTFGSMWGPWERGYEYNSPVILGVLRKKDVTKDQLPEYLKVIKLVSDIWNFNRLISNITNTNRVQLFKEGRISLYFDSANPLDRYMDSF